MSICLPPTPLLFPDPPMKFQTPSSRLVMPGRLWSSIEHRKHRESLQPGTCESEFWNSIERVGCLGRRAYRFSVTFQHPFVFIWGNFESWNIRWNAKSTFGLSKNEVARVLQWRPVIKEGIFITLLGGCVLARRARFYDPIAPFQNNPISESGVG